MKKMIVMLTALFTMTVSASAMSYEQARQQALFLTDKMAYELNLTEQQYEAAYEINLDYLMSVNTYDDLYGPYWTHRNLDLSYILFDWQYRAYCAASYFYRPLYWDAGYWHFGIYARYPRRDYFYFGRPHFWTVYRGGHSWHSNGGRSWYHGRDFGPRGVPRDKHIGMRDGFKRGDYRNGFNNRKPQGNNNNRNFGNNRDNRNFGGNRSFGNPGGTRNNGIGNNRNNGLNNRSNRPSDNRPQGGAQAPNGNRNFGGGSPSTRESSTRTTVTRGNTSTFGNVRGGSPQSTFGRNVRDNVRSNGTSSMQRKVESSTPARTFTPSRSAGSSSSFGNSRNSGSTRSFGSSSGSRSFSSGSHNSGGSRSFGGGNHGNNSGQFGGRR
ncbi:MAG: hypothetical protein IJV27_06925 [Prevotella sp.]|nr:hypothetical protein [Prevotella sp.]